MSDLFDKVTEDQDPFTRILGKIPGFKGYIERTSRRNADKILREQITLEYTELWKRIGEIQSDMASSGELLYLDDLETAATKLQTFIDKVSGAAYGYSGFFDFVRVNEAVLDDVYDHDMALMADVAALLDASEQLAAGTADGKISIDSLLGRVEDLHKKFDGRSALLEGLGGE